jgi:hypothetical protein
MILNPMIDGYVKNACFYLANMYVSQRKSKSEKTMIYYEFENRFEPRYDNVCNIFEGIDEINGRKFIYFRVVDKFGDTKNYAVFEGDF